MDLEKKSIKERVDFLKVWIPEHGPSRYSRLSISRRQSVKGSSRWRNHHAWIASCKVVISSDRDVRHVWITTHRCSSRSRHIHSDRIKLNCLAITEWLHIVPRIFSRYPRAVDKDFLAGIVSRHKSIAVFRVEPFHRSRYPRRFATFPLIRNISIAVIRTDASRWHSNCPWISIDSKWIGCGVIGFWVTVMSVYHDFIHLLKIYHHMGGTVGYAGYFFFSFFHGSQKIVCFQSTNIL